VVGSTPSASPKIHSISRTQDGAEHQPFARGSFSPSMPAHTAPGRGIRGVFDFRARYPVNQYRHNQ
jgi:hypothetical protein